MQLLYLQPAHASGCSVCTGLLSGLRTAVLKVAGQEVQQWAAGLYADLRHATSHQPVVVVHLGVDSKAERLRLEASKPLALWSRLQPAAHFTGGSSQHLAARSSQLACLSPQLPEAGEEGAHPAGLAGCLITHKPSNAAAPLLNPSLQWQAFNDATFRIPDEDGWQPQHEPVSPSWPLGARLLTRLPLPSLLGGSADCPAGWLASAWNAFASSVSSAVN